jgi:regulator of protease activity HflC (stomatin/prohibitin superfamily)
MITSFVGWLQEIVRGIRPWVTVKPWEQAVRVRLGKHAKLLYPGVYLKIPFMDTATIYPIRTRTSYAPLQTLRSADQRTVTIGLIIRYRIADLLRVLDTLHNPEGTLIHMAQGAVSDLVAETGARDITPDRITAAVMERIQPEQYGVEDFAVLVSDNADLSQRTFRLLQEGRYMDNGMAIDFMGKDA